MDRRLTIARLCVSSSGFARVARSMSWLRYYRALTRRLRTGFPCVQENDRLMIFELSPSK